MFINLHKYHESNVILLLVIWLYTPYLSVYSVRMRENADQNNSEYGHFLGSAIPILKYHNKLN